MSSPSEQEKCWILQQIELAEWLLARDPQNHELKNECQAIRLLSELHDATGQFDAASITGCIKRMKRSTGR